MNKILNDLVFSEKADEIMRAIGNGKNLIDFNKIIPMPEALSVMETKSVSADVSAFLSAVNPENTSIIYEKYTISKYNELYDELSTCFVHLKDDLSKVSFASCLNGKTYANNVLIYGYPTWYEWCNDKWGTPKGATEAAWNGTMLSFSTDGSNCEPVVQKIAQMFPEVTINYYWISEEPGAMCGESIIKGKKITRKELPEYSKESFEEYEKYFEVSLADYGYVYDKTAGTYIIP